MPKDEKPNVDYLIRENNDPGFTGYFKPDGSNPDINYRILSSSTEVNQTQGGYGIESRSAPLLTAAIQNVIDFFNSIFFGTVFTPAADVSSSNLTYGNAVVNEDPEDPNHNGDTDSTVGEYLANSTYSDPGGASGEVWVEENDLSGESPGGEAYWTYMHETMHALGLDDINSTSAKGTEADSMKYSVMSYNVHPSFDGTDMEDFFPETLMIDDYLALEALGWSFSANTESGSIYSFSENGMYLQTIKDDGGNNDIIIASGHTSNVILDLRQGHFSSVGASSNGSNNGRAVENVAIAYGTVIENATGGEGDDVIIGNVHDNYLKGGKGDDRIYGDGAATNNNLNASASEDGLSGWWEGADPSGNESGDDTLEGGEGNDLLVGGLGNDTYVFNMSTGDSENIGIDTIVDADDADIDVLQLNGITLGTLKPISADSNIYKDDSNDDIRVIISGTTARIVRASTKEIISMEGFDKTTNNFGLSFDVAAVPDNASINGETYNADGFDPQNYDAGESAGHYEGSAGNDLLQGESSQLDGLFGLDGDDTLIGDGTDKTDASTGTGDVLIGGRGNDQLYGGGGADVLHAMEAIRGSYIATVGLDYDDQTYSSIDEALYKGAIANIETQNETNHLDGGDGDDIFNGGSFNDTLIGGDGIDTLYAGAGQDQISVYIKEATNVASIYTLSMIGEGEGEEDQLKLAA